MLDVTKIYFRTGPQLMEVRGSAGQMQMAQWLIAQLDKQTVTASGAEMPMPGGKDAVVHVFYLAEGTNAGDALKSVRQMKVPVAYIRTSLPALTVRGTADQIAMVGATLTLR